MNIPAKDGLWICPECGARIAIGKYMPLQQPGKPDYCRAELAEVPTTDADDLLRTHLRGEE